MPTSYSGFSLWGLDVMVDEELNPYLIEINRNPGFATAGALYKNIIHDLCRETLFVSGYNIPPTISPDVKVNHIGSE